MTKEEIISEQLGMEYHSMTADQLSVYHVCMDEYAEQNAIAFGLWLTEGNFVKSESVPGSWYSDVDGEEYKRCTTKQVYAMFIEQQNKKVQ